MLHFIGRAVQTRVIIAAQLESAEHFDRPFPVLIKYVDRCMFTDQNHILVEVHWVGLVYDDAARDPPGQS